MLPAKPEQTPQRRQGPFSSETGSSHFQKLEVVSTMTLEAPLAASLLAPKCAPPSARPAAFLIRRRGSADKRRHRSTPLCAAGCIVAARYSPARQREGG